MYKYVSNIHYTNTYTYVQKTEREDVESMWLFFFAFNIIKSKYTLSWKEKKKFDKKEM